MGGACVPGSEGAVSKIVHGHARRGQRAVEYGIWHNMIARCHNPAHRDYPRYGGRGVYVDHEWRADYLAFLRDMGPRPAGRSLDRIDNDGPYTPWNCRWATQTEQMRNTRHNVLLTLNGETYCLREWCERLGVKRGFLRSRIRRGWTAERALTTPRLRHKETA